MEVPQVQFMAAEALRANHLPLGDPGDPGEAQSLRGLSQ